jgi:hypothetical protein
MGRNPFNIDLDGISFDEVNHPPLQAETGRTKPLPFAFQCFVMQARELTQGLRSKRSYKAFPKLVLGKHLRLKFRNRPNHIFSLVDFPHTECSITQVAAKRKTARLAATKKAVARKAKTKKPTVVRNELERLTLERESLRKRFAAEESPEKQRDMWLSLLRLPPEKFGFPITDNSFYLSDLVTRVPKDVADVRHLYALVASWRREIESGYLYPAFPERKGELGGNREYDTARVRERIQTCLAAAGLNAKPAEQPYSECMKAEQQGRRIALIRYSYMLVRMGHKTYPEFCNEFHNVNITAGPM